MQTTRPLAALVAVLLAIDLAGCASRAKPVLRPPVSKPLGTVGVAIAQQTPDANVQRPVVVGRGAGAKEGAKTGALVPLVPAFIMLRDGGSDPNVVFAGLVLLGAGVVLAPLGAGVGAAVGALTAPSREEVERSATAIQQALVDANLPEALTFQIIEAAPRPIVSAADPPALTVDTVLELDTPRVFLTSKSSTGDGDLRFYISLRGSLRQTSNGEELAGWLWDHEGRKATFLEWGGSEALEFRMELARAVQALATQVVKDVYADSPTPVPASER